MQRQLSVVIPVFNDEEVLDALFDRLVPVLDQLNLDYEIVMVDDASTDGSWRVLMRLRQRYSNVALLKLARNFGQDGAITAGLHHASGARIVIMDSDLQDPPEDIPKLLNALEESGRSMAISRWASRQDSLWKRKASQLFNLVMRRFTDVKSKPGMGVFRAMHREVAEAIANLPERTAPTLSLAYWLGYDYVLVDLQRDPRFAGTSGYTLGKMFRLALDRVLSHSIYPIRFAIALGVLLSCASLLAGLFLSVRTVFFKGVLPGWTSIVVLNLMLSGINFLILGVLGEYIGRVFLETKQRPKYHIGIALLPTGVAENGELQS
jgi:dolichol-phosphate mannosyltransferase